mmetsp:Transcript_65225/g.136637  ORF Transcript_65225/g.136637 Transcript_65225/m.136637 type:complete len:144 (+) Transcript_65225:307-738(+)
MYQFMSMFSGAYFLRRTPLNEKSAAEKMAKMSPQIVVETNALEVFCGACVATKEQPPRLSKAAQQEYQLNRSCPSESEKTNANAEDVEEITVFVATEVCSRLKLNNTEEVSHNTPALMTRGKAARREAVWHRPFSQVGSKQLV